MYHWEWRGTKRTHTHTHMASMGDAPDGDGRDGHGHRRPAPVVDPLVAQFEAEAAAAGAVVRNEGRDVYHMRRAVLDIVTPVWRDGCFRRALQQHSLRDVQRHINAVNHVLADIAKVSEPTADLQRRALEAYIARRIAETRLERDTLDAYIDIQQLRLRAMDTLERENLVLAARGARGLIDTVIERQGSLVAFERARGALVAESRCVWRTNAFLTALVLGDLCDSAASLRDGVHGTLMELEELTHGCDTWDSVARRVDYGARMRVLKRHGVVRPQRLAANARASWDSLWRCTGHLRQLRTLLGTLACAESRLDLHMAEMGDAMMAARDPRGARRMDIIADDDVDGGGGGGAAAAAAAAVDEDDDDGGDPVPTEAEARSAARRHRNAAQTANERRDDDDLEQRRRDRSPSPRPGWGARRRLERQY